MTTSGRIGSRARSVLEAGRMVLAPDEDAGNQDIAGRNATRTFALLVAVTSCGGGDSGLISPAAHVSRACASSFIRVFRACDQAERVGKPARNGR
jgi:hypothetical protein